VDPTGYPAGGQATLLGPGDLTLATHTFGGWNTMMNWGGSTYYPGQTVLLNQNLALYAMWTAATTYTVTYDPNGGTGGVPVDANQHIPEFPVYLQYAPVPNGPSGGVFDHWNTAADDSGFSYFPLTDATFPMPSHNVTLYAIYVFL
jgi:hypothetical protein